MRGDGAAMPRLFSFSVRLEEAKRDASLTPNTLFIFPFLRNSSRWNADIPEMPKTFPDLVKTVALLDAKQGVECVLFQAK
jgi:hypothetical protein